jgi:hypothetical protein
MQLRNTNVQDGQTKSNSYEPNFGVEKQIRLPSKYQLDQDLAQRGVSIAELKYEDAKHEVAKTLLNQWFVYAQCFAIDAFRGTASKNTTLYANDPAAYSCWRCPTTGTDAAQQ